MTNPYDARPALAQALKAVRGARQMTRREVAQRIGTTETTVYRWENNISTPDVNALASLASTYDVEMSAFMPSLDTIQQAQKAINKEKADE